MSYSFKVEIFHAQIYNHAQIYFCGIVSLEDYKLLLTLSGFIYNFYCFLYQKTHTIKGGRCDAWHIFHARCFNFRLGLLTFADNDPLVLEELRAIVRVNRDFVFHRDAAIKALLSIPLLYEEKIILGSVALLSPGNIRTTLLGLFCIIGPLQKCL